MKWGIKNNAGDHAKDIKKCFVLFLLSLVISNQAFAQWFIPPPVIDPITQIDEPDRRMEQLNERISEAEEKFIKLFNKTSAAQKVSEALNFLKANNAFVDDVDWQASLPQNERQDYLKTYHIISSVRVFDWF